MRPPFLTLPVPLRALCIVAIIATGLVESRALVGSNTGTNPPFNGLYINEFLGADAFYSSGFFGDLSVIVNVEAGAVWNGHETLSHVSTYIADPSLTGTTELGEFDRHATAVGQAIAGRGLYTYQDGIAPLGELWSASIATAWADTGEYSGGFDATQESFLYAYETALRTGVDGRTADVLNSSWGFLEPTGFNYPTIAIDALLAESNAVGVFAAGNSGPGTPSVVSPANGFNGIAVGALTGDTGPDPYSTLAGFSSRGYADFVNPVTGGTTFAIRPGVDLVAPGTSLTLAHYGGVTGGHRFGTDPTGGADDFYRTNLAGTSYAAPITAGGAALMVDAGRFLGAADMIDARVIKAVLLTSAWKPAGWDNGQAVDAGVIRTERALDAAWGAGRLDLGKAWEVYVGDSLLAPGPTTRGLGGIGGGQIAARGWDLAQVAPGVPVRFRFLDPLAGGSLLTATITWYASRTLDPFTKDAADLSLDDLALELWTAIGMNPGSLIAVSDSPVSTLEHFRVSIPATGSYLLQVVWRGEVYDATGDADLADFGIAWNVDPVPEPGAASLVFAAAALLLAPRRRSP